MQPWVETIVSDKLKICCVLLVVMALSACVSTSPPKREVYTGKDQVGQINKDMIMGDWEVTILNPIEGEQGEFKPVAHYSPDGSLLMDAKFNSGGVGDIELEVIGTWAVEGDTVKQVATDIREKSGGAVGMVLKLFKGMVLKNSNAVFNVYEASANRLLVVSDDGQAQEFNRVK